MATGLQVGEDVFVPVSLLDDVGEQPSAFLRRPVLELAHRSVRVDVGGASHWVASSKCQRNIGLLIFSIGDLETETTLLDPLSKSVTQFCRLLASDDYVRFYKIRSMAELAAIWARDHSALFVDYVSSSSTAPLGAGGLAHQPCRAARGAVVSACWGGMSIHS